MNFAKYIAKEACAAINLAIALLIVSSASPAMAQTTAVATSPPNIVVPNYEGVPVGPFGGLEANADVARTSDPSAAWFNPAGLSRAKGAQISGSAGMYQYTKLSPKINPDTGSSVQHVPNLVGFTIETKRKFTLGAAILTPVSWEQTTNMEVLTSDAIGNPERFAYSATSTFDRRVIAASAGYDSEGKWRFGGGLTLMYTALNMRQASSDRIAEPTSLHTLLVASGVRGSVFQLGAVAGVQVDPKPWLQIGGALRTPGATFYKSGNITLDGTEDTGPGNLGASFLDTSAKFQFKVPMEFDGAVALVGKRAEIEVDVHTYMSISPYQMMSSSVNKFIYQDAGTGAAPTISQQPYAGLTSASRSLANVAVGGHFQVKENSELRVHYGIATDFSPVADEDQVFSRVDLIAWTFGLSGGVNKLNYAAGINYRGGTSDNLFVRNLLSGQPVQTSIHIRTIGMIYSLTYKF